MPSILAKGLVTGYLLFSISSCKEEEKKSDVSPEVNVVVAGKESIPVYSEYVGEVYGLIGCEYRPPG